MICENCGKEHDGSYGSGRFCSKSCSISWGNKHRTLNRSLINKHISEGVRKYNEANPKQITYYHYRCEKCGKEFESTCDIHHIIPKSQGGTNEHNNLIIVCPNCHRIIHTSDKYSIEFLQERSIERQFNDWKNYYHPSN